MSLRYLILIGGMVILVLSCRQLRKNEPYKIDQFLAADSAMVVTAHPLASEIGVQILKTGGNAVDAAVASQFALAVVYPRAGNIGGGGFMVIRTEDGRTFSLDYRERAPLKAFRDMYLDKEGILIDSLSIYGYLAAGVPGSVAGLLEAWEKYGKIPELSTILEPAITLAREGFFINADEAERLNKYRADFLKYNDHAFPFVKNGSWHAGDRLVQKELANTLSMIRDQGRAGFYRGSTAMAIDSQMRVHGGLITQEDLSDYEAIWRDPVTFNYREYRIISMPPPSSGGIALAQLFGMLERYDLGSMPFQGPESIHLIAEAERRVYADRAKYLGDPDFFSVHSEALKDSVYLLERMRDYNPLKVTPSDMLSEGQVWIQAESYETTHTSVVDPGRMAVSVTTTLNSNYGSKVWIRGGGFFLNNEMDDFSVKPGVANQLGLVGGEANAILPGKRMLSSMSPTIVEKHGKLFMVLGSPGGSTIITSVLQVILHVTEWGMNIREAVEAGRFHHQWLPDSLMYEEARFEAQVLDSLQKKGHALDPEDRIGLVKAILVRPDGLLEGAGDPRSFDDAEGY